MKRNIPVSIKIAGLVTILVVLASGFSLTAFGIDKVNAPMSIPKAWGSVKGVIDGGGVRRRQDSWTADTGG